MASTTESLRQLGADELRPLVPGVFMAVTRAVGIAADAVGRWAWVHEYEAAERRYWGNRNDK